jgi:predicted  nucleic acid-binding Zn-ribbon protein
MDYLRDMWSLQLTEVEIVKIRREWEQIKELLAREIKSDLISIRDGISAARVQWQRVKEEYDRVVMETEKIARQLHQQNQQLYSDGGQSKELVSIQQKIEQLQKQKNSLEERQLGNIEQLDSLEKKIANETCRLQRLEEQSRSRVNRLKSRQHELKAEYEVHKVKREELRQQIPRAMLVVYNDLVAKKKRPLALLKEDSCSACGMVQSILNINALKKGGAYTKCSSCGRILVPDFAVE